MAIKYDSKIIHLTLSAYDRNKIDAIANAIADGDQENSTFEWHALRAGRVRIEHVYVGTAAANGEVEEVQIDAMFDNDPLRTARVLGAILGASDIIVRMDINSGRTVRW